MSMIDTVINERYKVTEEIKPPRDGKIYLLVEDLKEKDEYGDNFKRMLKGIFLFGEKEREEAGLEVDLLKQLDHPNVIKLFEDFEFTSPENYQYHAMILEYIKGVNLADYCNEKLEENSDGEEEFALTVSAQLVCALDHIHDQNIIHRDVKPENVLLDYETAKLADFNISRETEGTVTTGVAGTPDYLPPEAIKNPESEKLCFRRDMWGLGIIFQMLCTFRHPFAGENSFETMMNIVNNKRTPAQVRFPSMESLIKQCLVPEISERVESASALMKHPSLYSLIGQLNNGIEPHDLEFGKNRVETLEIVNEHLRKENEYLKNESDELKEEKSSLQDRLENLWKIGIGHYYGLDSRDMREEHSKTDVRSILKAIKNGGVRKINLKFIYRNNLEVSEAGWTIRHQSSWESYRGDGFWKMWILCNGKRVDFQADADEIYDRDGKSYKSAKKLTPDQAGMIKLEGICAYVRWNITIRT